MDQAINKENIKLGYDKASYLCSRREYCESGIFTKLIQWKLTKEEAAIVVEKLKAERFIDNERYAQAFARDKSKFSAWGAVKITMALRLKKIDDTIIKTAIENLPGEQFFQQALKEGSKKYKSLRDEDLYAKKQKLARYLFSKGFESSIVWKAIASITSTHEVALDEFDN